MFPIRTLHKKIKVKITKKNYIIKKEYFFVSIRAVKDHFKVQKIDPLCNKFLRKEAFKEIGLLKRSIDIF